MLTGMFIFKLVNLKINSRLLGFVDVEQMMCNLADDGLIITLSLHVWDCYHGCIV